VWEHALYYRCRKASKLKGFVPSRDRHGKKKVEIACWNFDAFVKRQKMALPVIPAKAGIQEKQAFLDSRLRGSGDHGDSLRTHQFWSFGF
jgi:hypothetical protein